MRVGSEAARDRIAAGAGATLRGWAPVLPTLLVGLLLSLLVFGVVWRGEQSRTRSEFQELADERIGTVRLNTGIALDAIVGLAEHFAVSAPGATSRADFAELTQPLIARHPFIQALEWIPRVSQAERVAREADARAQGEGDFQLRERDAEGRLRPAARRPVYFPVFYVEPLAGNREAVGFDLASNPARQAALQAASVSGRMAATSRIVLVQEHGHQYGVLLYAPVFSRATPQAARVLRGFALGVFRIGDLMDAGAPRASPAPRMVNLRLYDLSAPPGQQQLYPRDAQQPLAAHTEALERRTAFSFADRDWLLVATPTAAFEHRSRHAASFMTLMAALLATGLFGLNQKHSQDRARNSLRFAGEMARSKQRLDQAHRIASLGFLECDAGGAGWRVSDGAARLLGVAPAEVPVPTEQICAQVHAQDRDDVVRALRQGHLPDRQLQFRVGERVVQLLAGEPAAEADPALPRLVTLQDVTQRHRAELERAAIVTRMIETGRLEALGTLAGGIAHEINTPSQFIADNLRFIAEWLPSLLDLLRDARAAAASGNWSAVAAGACALRYEFAARELPQAVEQSLDGVERVSTIVRAIREFSAPSGREPQYFDLNRAVEITRVVTRNQWRYCASVELELAEALPPMLGIESEINQVLVNLLVNAVQAIEERGASAPPGHIHVTTRSVGGKIELVVRDDGVGIDEANLSKIFDLFFTTKPPGRGTGQGLAISQAIVLRHGGQISVRSQPGHGATFIVTLPAHGAPRPA